MCVCVGGGSTCLYVFVDRNEYIIQENKAFKFSYVFNIFTGVTFCDRFPSANVDFVTKSSHAICMF